MEQNLPKDRIIALCAPASLYEKEDKNTRKHIGNTLRTWIKLGLFVESKDGISINPEVSKGDLTLERLPSVARSTVLKRENNANFFDKEDSGSADFTRLLAWSLMQDIWEYDQTSDVVVSLRLDKQTKDDDVFKQNDTRWSGFKAWTQFLGFAWSPRYPNSKIEPDPTSAIIDVLPKTFEAGSTVEAPELIQKLADAIPVLDGGEYRIQVEKRLGETSGEYSWRPLPPHQISTTLSRSLMRLRENGLLDFVRKDDSKQLFRCLTGRDRRPIGDVSHFTLNFKNL
jgi:hypothetical protein